MVVTTPPRGSKETLKKISDKTARTRSNPIVLIKDGKSIEFPSAKAASRALGLNAGNLVQAINSQHLTVEGYKVTRVETPDLPGEVWRPLPNVDTIPGWMWERRKDPTKRPCAMWAKTLVSTMGRVRLGVRVTYGREVCGYSAVEINEMQWYVHVLCALVFKLEQFGVDFQIDHADGDKYNNKVENLIPMCPADHCAKTRKDYPDASFKVGVTVSRLLRLTESPNKELIGKVQTLTDWTKELQLSSRIIANAVAIGGRAGRKHRFEIVFDELLEGEEEFAHEVYVGTELVPYKVSSFGRFWRNHKWQTRNGKNPKVKLRGQNFLIYQLVLMAKTGDKAKFDFRMGRGKHRLAAGDLTGAKSDFNWCKENTLRSAPEAALDFHLRLIDWLKCGRDLRESENGTVRSLCHLARGMAEVIFRRDDSLAESTSVAPVIAWVNAAAVLARYESACNECSVDDMKKTAAAALSAMAGGKGKCLTAWIDLEEGTEVTVIEDVKELERLCNRAPPGATVQVNWVQGMAKFAGDTCRVVRKGDERHMNYQLKNSAGNAYSFPFDVIILK
jgi:hypothetical protein